MLNQQIINTFLDKMVISEQHLLPVSTYTAGRAYISLPLHTFLSHPWVLSFQNGFLNQVKPLCAYKHITVYGNDTLLRFNGSI